jgi:hypothetical protein
MRSIGPASGDHVGRIDERHDHGTCAWHKAIEVRFAVVVGLLE